MKKRPPPHMTAMQARFVNARLNKAAAIRRNNRRIIAAGIVLALSLALAGFGCVAVFR